MPRHIESMKGVESYLNTLDRFGIKLGLDRMERLMEALGSPQRHYRTVHIAGSKGKGCVVAALSLLLRGSGIKVGTYMSPHVLDTKERIRVNGEMVDERTFAEAMDDVKSVSEAKAINVTRFEALTAAAMLCFHRLGVDYAVLETGMGGRLDATNIATKKLLCGITDIELEHTEYLGNTLGSIASEKAAIINSNSIRQCYTTNTAPSALNKIIERCQECGVGLSLVMEGGADGDMVNKSPPPSGLRIHSVSVSEVTWQGTKAVVKMPKVGGIGFQIPLIGGHYALNTAMALAMAYDITPDALGEGAIKGLSDLTRMLPGRAQVIEYGGRKYILDGAHTPMSMEALMRSVRSIMREAGPTVVLGILNDKNAEGIVDVLIRNGAKVIVTRSKSPRAMAPDKIANTFRHQLKRFAKQNSPCSDVHVAQSVEDALDMAAQMDDSGGVVVTGSFTTVSDALNYLPYKDHHPV